MSPIAPTSPRPFGANGVAMVTPFAPDGDEVDLAGAQALAEHLVGRGVDLLVVGGTTGESATTSDDEKCAVLSAVREAVGERATLVAGVGSYDTRHSVALARRTAQLGVDGLLVVTPYYSRPSQEGIARHIEAIADATDVPVMLYDIPGRTGVPLSRETLLRLGGHERIRAVKDAKGDFAQAAAVMARCDLAYYGGEDAINLPWLAIGAAGIVSVVGHVVPELHAELLAAVDRSDLPHAREVHHRLAPLTDAIMGALPGVVAVKTALALQGVLPHAAVRGPLAPADAAQTRVIAEALEAVRDFDGGATTPRRSR